MRKSKTIKAAWITFAGIIAAAIITGSFSLLKSDKPKNKATVSGEKNITSVGQTGGITADIVIQADTVNVTPQNRRITNEQLKILLPALQSLSQTKIKVSYATGNKEQKQFAEDIINVLRLAESNFEAKHAIHSNTPYGNGLHFAVNSEKPYPAGSSKLQQALKNAHIDSEWYGIDELPRNVILIVIGEKP